MRKIDLVSATGTPTDELKNCQSPFHVFLPQFIGEFKPSRRDDSNETSSVIPIQQKGLKNLLPFK